MPEATPSRPVVIGIGGSAGGVEAMRDLVGTLAADLPACVLMLLHQPDRAATVLAELLARRSVLPVTQARDGEPPRPGHIHLARPDRHLLLRDGRLALAPAVTGARFRPGLDPLLRSLADELGPRAIGVVLSGLLDDGAAGLSAIARAGGAAVVQDPADARFPGMPRAALAEVPDAVVAGVADLPGLLHGLASTIGGAPQRGRADEEAP